jgi:hypothetical protein
VNGRWIEPVEDHFQWGAYSISGVEHWGFASTMLVKPLA